tara:strand:+ start:399 stop:1499 length:1101 start_codon:yes stop_codon:yes gene_type:complete
LIIYYLIFLVLSFLAYREISNPKPLNIYSILFLVLLFSVFIGLRNEIGCDWEGYKNLFNREICTSMQNHLSGQNNCLNSFEYLKYKEIGFTIINLIIKSLGGNFYTANYIFSLLFLIPIIQFCSNLERPYLAILISYPYLITVIGLGSIRQSIAIAILMICINELREKRFYKYFIYIAIATLFHYSSFIFMFLPLLIDIKKDKNLKRIKGALLGLFFVFIFLFLIFNDNFLMKQLSGYLIMKDTISFITPLIIWMMISISASIILLNYKVFRIDDSNHFWRNYSILGIFMILPIFFNTIIAFRFLYYFYPVKIYSLSNLTKIERFKDYPKSTFLAIFIFSLSILTIWLNFANHSYCYLPYKNLLLK